MSTSIQDIVLAATAVSGTTVYPSNPILLRGATSVGFQAIWTGTPTGSFSWEYSPDYDPMHKPAADARWYSLTVPAAFSSGNPAGTASGFLFDFSPPPTTKAIRVKYTNASSTGTVEVIAEIRWEG